MRKMLQQENLISKAYVSIDGETGNEIYAYFRLKEQKFKPSKSQGAGLNVQVFVEEATAKGLKQGFDFFVTEKDYRYISGVGQSNASENPPNDTNTDIPQKERGVVEPEAKDKELEEEQPPTNSELDPAKEPALEPEIKEDDEEPEENPPKK